MNLTPDAKLDVPLSFAAFDSASRQYDDAVSTCDLPDRFCTSTDWIIPAQRAFAAEAESWVFRGSAGWAPLMKLQTPLGRTLVPLEASWGLTSPFVGQDQGQLVDEVVDWLMPQRTSWDSLFLCGLVSGGPAFTQVVRRLMRYFRLGLGSTTVRCVASLDDGLDGFLSRRKRTFRKSLRQSQRKADRMGIVFEHIQPTTPQAALEAFERVLAVESNSWKGREGHGITLPSMQTFYREMVTRLAVKESFRVTFARHEGRDIGFVFGGIFAGTYRGLQISFAHDYGAVGLGNLLQLQTVTKLCEEGCQHYDLGTLMDYKKSWAEQRIETVPLVVT